MSLDVEVDRISLPTFIKTHQNLPFVWEMKVKKVLA
jgi:hypothetical protein